MSHSVCICVCRWFKVVSNAYLHRSSKLLDCKKRIPKLFTQLYYCQENASMHEGAIIEWVDNILKPYIKMAPNNIFLLFVLDVYQFHMMISLVEVIQQLVVEVEHIPDESTFLCQPINVGISLFAKIGKMDVGFRYQCFCGYTTCMTIDC